MDESNLTVLSASALSPKPDQQTNSEELLTQAVASMKEIKIELDTDLPDDLTPDAVLAEYLGDPNEPENEIQIRLDEESPEEEEVSDGEIRFGDFVSKQVKDNLKDSGAVSTSQQVGGNSSLDDKTNVRVVASRFKPHNYKLVSKTDDVKGDITDNQPTDKDEQLKATPTSVSSFTRDLLDFRQMRQQCRQVQRALKNEMQQLTEKPVGESQEKPVPVSTGTSKKRTVTRQTVSSARGLEHFKGWQVPPNWPLSHGWSDTPIYGEPSLAKPTEMDSEIPPQDVLRASGKSMLCVSKERTSKVTEHLRKLKMIHTDDK